MKNNWRILSDFIIFSIKGITPKYIKESSIIVLNQKCIRNNKINYSLSQFTDDTNNISENKFVKEGDILINSTGTGTAGRCAFVKKIPNNYRLIVDSHILILRCNSYYEAQCISYLLYSFEKELMTFMTGSSGQSELDKVVLLGVKTKLTTDNNYQKKIAHILSTLDSKIELNNKINSELEKMAKTLYDYWFVQFDFPDENGNPYKSNRGKMVYNEELKREIPDGWEVKKMNNIINTDKSGDWGKEKEMGNYIKKVSCIRGADINGLMGNGLVKSPIRYILEKNSNKILKSHDIVIEISGGSPTQSTGRIAFVTEPLMKRFKNPLICSNFCKPISLKNKNFLYNFVFHWNSLYDNNILFRYEGKTSGLKNLLFDIFSTSCYFILPKDEILNNFYEFMKSIDNKKQVNLEENQKLEELRDWLLPMLMNGQVEVV